MTMMRSSCVVSSVKLSLVNRSTAGGGGFQSGLLRSAMKSTMPSHTVSVCSRHVLPRQPALTQLHFSRTFQEPKTIFAGNVYIWRKTASISNQQVTGLVPMQVHICLPTCGTPW